MPTLQLRRGPQATAPTLAVGEPGFTTDTFRLYVGSSAGNTLIGGSGTGAGLVTDTDGTLAANSDANVATQKATKTYVDNAVTGLLDLKGGTDASGNPNYPAASKGDAYYVTVAGKVGGASGKSVDVGDVYLATADNAGGTEAAVGTSWIVLEHNITAGSGIGDVVGPASSTDNALARFDGTTGKLLQNSALTVGDAGEASLTYSSATTNTATTMLSLAHATSGTAADGFGLGVAYLLESASGTERSAAAMRVVWATAADATRKARVIWDANDTGSRECLRMEASGTAAMIGFLGAAASAQLASPDLATLATTFGLASGTPTLARRSLAGGAYFCRVKKDTSQSINATTYTKVTIDTTISDADSMFSANKITVPVAGKYLVVAFNAAEGDLLTSSALQNMVKVNNATEYFGDFFVLGNAYGSRVNWFLLDLAASDYVELYVYADDAFNTRDDVEGGKSTLTVYGPI